MHYPDIQLVNLISWIQSIEDSTSKLASEKLLTTVKDIEIYANNDKQYQLLINKIKSGNFVSNITFEDPGIKEFFLWKR